MNREIRIDEYRLAHGKRPRGLGAWAFRFSGPYSEPHFAPGTVTYSAACRWARRTAKANGFEHIEVCS